MRMRRKRLFSLRLRGHTCVALRVMNPRQRGHADRACWEASHRVAGRNKIFTDMDQQRMISKTLHRAGGLLLLTAFAGGCASAKSVTSTPAPAAVAAPQTAPVTQQRPIAA